MARAWSEVVADPNFQALDPQAQESARNAYFQQNVLPNIPQDANAGAIRLKFDQETVPTLKRAPAAPATPPLTALEHAKSVGSAILNHPFTTGVGLAENALSGITGGVGNLADAVTLSQPGTHDWAYRPRTEAGQAIAQASGQEAAAIGRTYDKIPGADTPLGQTIKEFAPEALGAIGTVTGAAEVPRAVSALRAPKPTFSAQDVVNNMAAGSAQNQGAAAAAPRVNAASPELQQAIVKTAQQTGGIVNPEVLQRHLEADSLPVKINLTEGQATQDPVALSHEQNLRGQQKEFAEHFDRQNKQLAENVQAIRDQIGPDVFSTNPVEHGDTLIDAYKANDKAASTKIDQAYEAARAAVPDKTASVMDAPQLLSDVTKALHENDLFDSAPSDIMKALQRRADNNAMSFSNIENLRTNLARIQRSPTADGNLKYAAGVIRDTLEQAPLTVQDAAVKGLYDQARALARARFQALEADPAYKAAVYETTPADKFVRKFVINGNRDDVATMRQNLANNSTATQTLGVSVLDHLRDQAGLTPDYKGNFTQAGYNKALRGLDPKLQSLVDPRTAEQLQTLGNVANYTQFQPRGSFVNNSNTFVAGAADYGAGALEGAANVAAHGIPVGTWGRKAIAKIQAGKQVRAAISPGAGLGRLAVTSPQVEQMLQAARARAAAAQQVP